MPTLNLPVVSVFLLVDYVGTAVFGPGLFIAASQSGMGFTKTADKYLLFFGAGADKGRTNAFGALETEPAVVLDATAFISIAFDSYARFRVAGQVTGMGA